MTLSVWERTAAIRFDTEGLAGAAENDLALRIEHCPDWSVADLVWHLTCVHGFWTEVVSGLPPAERCVQRPLVAPDSVSDHSEYRR